MRSTTARTPDLCPAGTGAASSGDDAAISIRDCRRTYARRSGGGAALFRSYAASLDVDLFHQGFEAELRSLPGCWAAPGGVLLLAREAGGTPSGCAALRPLAHHVAVR
jgi:hypothetical protein